MKTPQRQTIEQILDDFFSEQRSGKTGVPLRRLRLIEGRLRECVESEAERILVDSDLRILAAERQFTPERAVARTMHADDLLYLLSMFVQEQWLPGERVQRTRHLRLASVLADHLLRSGLVNPEGMSCPLIDIRVAVDRERALQHRTRRENQAARQPDDYHG